MLYSLIVIDTTIHLIMSILISEVMLSAHVIWEFLLNNCEKNFPLALGVESHLDI